MFPKRVNPETQLRYESFFSGFLYFYDTEVRNGMSDYTMYCRWQKFNKNQDTVTVYIDPPPLRHKLKPIPGTSLSTKTPDEYEQLMLKNNKRLKETIFSSAWTPPAIDGMQSDPPSPQGPPPPPPNGN